MRLLFKTFTTDNDVDVMLVPETSTDQALLRSLQARNPRVEVLREGSDLKIRFKGAK